MSGKRLVGIAALLVAGLWASGAWGADLVIFPTSYMDNPRSSIAPPDPLPTEAKIFASRGEYEPLAFAVRSTQLLDTVSVKVGDLVGPRGKIGGANVTLSGMGRVVDQGRGNFITVLGPAKPVELPANTSVSYWLTVKVPDDAAPGTYRGAITAEGGNLTAKLDVALEVLDIKLDEPTQAIGFNYSWPKSVEVLRAQLKDMREHGMTGVGPLYGFHLPIYDNDVSDFDTFVREYQQAGYKTTLWVATPMNMSAGELKGFGEVDSPRFVRRWKKVMEALYGVTEKYNQPAIFSVGDEYTNQGLKGVETSERLAKMAFDTLPQLPCGSDINGYQELMRTSKYYDAAAFNIGWGGADNHNGNRTLLNRKTIEEVVANNCKPWFVNAGKGRMSYGYWFWKMASYGMQGKIEWYYNLGNPPYERGSMIFVYEGKTCPTLDYERSREGCDDMKYLVTLENRIAAARQAGRGDSPAVTKAEKLLQQVRSDISDDWTDYRQGDGSWSPAKFDNYRRQVAECILEVK